MDFWLAWMAGLDGWLGWLAGWLNGWMAEWLGCSLVILSKQGVCFSYPIFLLHNIQGVSYTMYLLHAL